MIKRFLYRLFERRHYWREVSFGEMAELYASRLLRTLAVSMVSVFIGIYLYQNGYGITFIFVYFALYFVYRSCLAWPLAYTIAKSGPKHAMLISNLLYVPSLLLYAVISDYGITALVGAAVFQGLSVTLYDIAYMVDFSKVRSLDHTGKELGYMHILEQVAKGLSPVIGGFIAYLFGPQATLIFASTVFALAAAPLFFTPEQVKTHQHITFRGLPYKRISGTAVAELAVGVDWIASGVMWSLLLAIGVFGIADNAVYAQLGILSSITIIVGVAVARLFGVIVDKNHGRELLRAGVLADSITHILRPFIATPIGALLLNIMNESVTTAYALPLTKAIFAQADDLPGYRIVYMSIVSAMLAMGAAVFCGIIGLISLYADELLTLRLGYVIAALTVLTIMLNNLPALRRKRTFLG